MLNYLNVTYNQLVQQFQARLKSDPRFKNITSATIFGMFTEMLAAVTDMTNFYIQRTAEEGFISTAKLDSSIIKHCKNLGYNPRRPVPARCELVIRIKGPLPATLTAGTEVFFNRDTTKLMFNGNPFILDNGYSYVFTEEDIINGTSSDWYRDLTFAVPQESSEYIPLIGINLYNTVNTTPIKCFQAEQKIVEFLGTANIKKLGEPCQFYDVDDVNFSNWYGKRDPYAFIENVYDPTLSWCQVGIGADEVDAFNKENIYKIETQSIYLSDDIINLNGKLPEEPLKICLIDTNPDKTVRVTFSSEPNIASIGLKTDKDNLYVKYLSTKGKEANTVGVNGAVMTHNNQINVSVKGSIVSLTNNVQFIINSDIYGGENFESQASMKINAPAYFSSRGKLITRDDYMSYFRALSSPMTVQTAMVFGQHDIEDTIGFLHPLCQNNIIYCLMGHLYLKNPNGNWTVRNVLTEDDYNTTDTFSLYGNKYLEHLCDYIKLLKSYQGFYNCQYSENPQDQWLRNIQLINKNCQFNSEINSVIFSLPPYVQYFDAVGTVYVKPLTDIEAYMNEMKNRVYEYLDSRVSTHKKIYKSEIIKLYNEHPATVSTDIDFKVSELIKSDLKKYFWNKKVSPGYEFIQNKSLETYTTVLNSYTESAGGLTKEAQLKRDHGDFWWNEVKIPNIDAYGNKMFAKMFEERNIEIDILKTETKSGADTKVIIQTNTFSAEVSENENFIVLTPKALQDGTVDFDNIDQFNVVLPNTNDFYSSTTFSPYKTDEYNLAPDQIKSIQTLVDDWLANKLYTITSAQRAIYLPYTVTSSNVNTREETIMRKGSISLDNEMTLSENSFWNYLVPKIIDTYYAGKIKADSNIYDGEWEHITNLIMDIYPKIKPGICDSILDNNNNITNFSTQMERACLRNIINVQYYQDN
jgi:hypothetical protein